MPKINVLSKKTAELIAAGEVVERPASVVKELIENAIDSGAHNITVEIKNGGKTYIRVSDDGCGISSEDLPKTILRHATSKIATEADLENIATLGFRGEALASVCAVSSLQILTCTPDSIMGSRLEYKGGEEIYVGEAGSPKGTTVIVRDLFFNTPARLKFLKKDSTESGYIGTICEKVFISHPDISFRFIRDGEVVMTTKGDGNTLSAITSVYGKSFGESLCVIPENNNKIKITGYISKPNQGRANRNMQIFFVNGRYVKSKVLYAAIDEAYKGSMTVGKFPACVLFIDIDYDKVDVNVHPAKTEVRFYSDSDVFDDVYFSVKAGIKGESAIPEKSQDIIVEPKSEMQNQLLFMNNSAVPDETVIPEKKPSATASTVFERYKTSEQKPSSEEIKSFTKMVDNLSKVYNDIPVKEITITDDKTAISEENENLFEADNKDTTDESAAIITDTDVKVFKYIGELFDTYILGELGEDAVLIDKHAAHERLIYERLKAENSKSSGQLLLMPISITLTSEEMDAFIVSQSDFERLGFSATMSGKNTVLIREIPMIIDESDASAAFYDILELIMKNSKRKNPDVLDELLHSVACRAAIKAHDKSSPDELIAFAKEVIDSDARYCPHGRPVMIKIPKKEIEKRFFRI